MAIESATLGNSSQNSRHRIHRHHRRHRHRRHLRFATGDSETGSVCDLDDVDADAEAAGDSDDENGEARDVAAAIVTAVALASPRLDSIERRKTQEGLSEIITRRHT